MKAVYLVALLSVGCGSGSHSSDDLSVPAVDDLSTAVVDLASVPPPDMTIFACTAPKPGIYTESLTYTYVPANGGMTTLAGNNALVVVRNDGAFTRPSNAFPAPNLFHCNFTTVDAMTCLAACCPDQAASPIVYVDVGGWTLWLGGACAYQTTTGAQYVANVTNVEGYFSR